MSTAARSCLSALAVKGCLETSDACEAAAETASTSWVKYGIDASKRCCALTIRDDAINSIAFVIFLVAWTERIRRRKTLSCAPMN